MRIPESVRAQFRRYGEAGGRARARRLSAPERAAIAGRAGVRRWIRARFGEPTFAALGLPGGATIDRGLDDLAAGRVTVESLLVSLASPRLRREGVPLPRAYLRDGDRRLYRLLERTEGELAHARYLARLDEVSSFADACQFARLDRNRRAK